MTRAYAEVVHGRHPLGLSLSLHLRHRSQPDEGESKQEEIRRDGERWWSMLQSKYVQPKRALPKSNGAHAPTVMHPQTDTHKRSPSPDNHIFIRLRSELHDGRC